jgi:glucose/arabinose dehydrogenase
LPKNYNKFSVIFFLSLSKLKELFKMKKFASLLLLFTCYFSHSQEIGLEEIATGFSAPLNIQHANDDRLFIVEQGGLIKIIEDGNINPTPFLDISNQISSGGERGLLGLAFHPNYQNNGRFFVYYIDNNGDSQLSEFTVDGFNPNVAIPSSEINLLSISQPASNHNGGCIAFGPDGMLYIASGDGGGSGDPNNNAQNLNSLLGKILRLDIDLDSPYIPTDNPFIDNNNALDEIWAYGLRNPWKFSFDFADGSLWIGDVGQNEIEEINKTDNSAGLNYGWRCYEGSEIYDDSQNCPPNSELTFPFAEYSHSATGVSRCSITGGYVYRAIEYPNFVGKYIFADFCSSEIGVLDPDGELTFSPIFGSESFSSFGLDNQNNLYVASIGSGKIYKIIDTSLDVDNFSSEEISIYPNPTSSNKINFKSSSVINKIELFSVQGQLIQQKEVNTTNGKFNINGLSTGVYLLKLTNNHQQTLTKQVIIK